MSEQPAVAPESIYEDGNVPQNLRELIDLIKASPEARAFLLGPIPHPKTNAEVCHNINLYWKKRTGH